jgi:hypothetical protein
MWSIILAIAHPFEKWQECASMRPMRASVVRNNNSVLCTNHVYEQFEISSE